MSSNETNSPLEAILATVRGATKLVDEPAKSDESEEKLTPGMLASAIKLAALTNDHQEKLTPAAVNAAINLAKKPSNEQKNLTPESLATALKLATKASHSASSDDNNDDKHEVSGNQLLAAMKAAIAMTQEDQTQEHVTSELLADALKLAKH